MTWLKITVICALTAINVFAGKVITYTATSQQSQEDANNAAMAGVAKQVSAQIKVNQTLSKEDVSSGKENIYTESYKSNSNVLSDIKIKGISVKPETTAKGFKATASLDLDEFTADIQFKMKSIQMDVSKQEEIAVQSLNERNYSRAIEAITKAEPMPQKYKALVAELSKVYPINESHRLKQNISDIKTDIISRLSDIQFAGPNQQFVLTKKEMQAFDVIVSDKEGTIAKFPLVAKQGRTVLEESLTQENGSSTFVLRDVNIDKGPYVIVIEPNLPEEYLKASGLRKKLELDFKVVQARCAVNIQCKENGNICNNLEKQLAKKSIFVDKNVEKPKLALEVKSIPGKPIEYVPGKFTTPFDVNFSLKGENISFVSSGHANGKQDTEAKAAVIKKINFEELRKQLEIYCK